MTSSSEQFTCTDQDGDEFTLRHWGEGDEGSPFTASIAATRAGQRTAAHLTLAAAQRLHAFLHDRLYTEATQPPVRPEPPITAALPVQEAPTFGGGEVLPHGGGEPDPLRIVITGGHGPALLYITDTGVPVRLDQDKRVEPGLTVQENLHGLPQRDWAILSALMDHAAGWLRAFR